MDQYCRICSRSDEAHKFPLSTVSQICQETIEDMLIYCTQLEVVPFDGLPQIICAECLNALNAAFFFRKLCYKSDSVLKELRRNASVDLQPGDQPPQEELIAFPEKLTEASSELILKEENYESEDIIESLTEAIVDPCPLEEQESNRNFPANLLLENGPMPMYVCKHAMFCGFKTLSRSRMVCHQIKKKHSTYEIDGNVNSLDDLLFESSDAGQTQMPTYMCKHYSLCEYRSATRTNFERHQKLRKHSNFETVNDLNRKVYKCGECIFEHHTLSFLRKHQSKHKHALYTIHEAQTHTCPHCKVQRKSRGNLIRHLKTCSKIREMKKIKKIMSDKQACQPADEVLELKATDEKLGELVSTNQVSMEETEEVFKERRIGTPSHVYFCKDTKYCTYTTKRPERWQIHQRDKKHEKFEIQKEINASDGMDNFVSCTFVCKTCEPCKYQTKYRPNFLRHQRAYQHRGFERIGINYKRKVYKCQECYFQCYELMLLEKHQQNSNHALFSTKCKPNIPSLENRRKKAKNHNSQEAIKDEPMGNILKLPPNVSTPEIDCLEIEANPTPSKVAEFSQEQDVSKEIGSNNYKSNEFMRCDFCNYSIVVQYSRNMMRHLATKCKSWQYKDETEDIFSKNILQSVRDSVDDIATWTTPSGQKLFTNQYVPESFSSTSMSIPPLELICSVKEYAWWLVITMRGFRCCGCSLFFIDESSLLKHREMDHAALRLTISKRKLCLQCYRVLPNQESLEYHQQLEKSNKLMYCIPCAQIVVSNTAWISHCSMLHNNLTTDTS